MSVFYNDFSRDSVDWLNKLVNASRLPVGDISGKSITELQASEVDGYTQCHFFCGIGGWPLALKMAEVPEHFNVWTGSCPCQPFSAANKDAKGFDDERDLWKDFFRLIKDGKPDFVFGEQVPTAASNGWLDRLCTDLQSEGYIVLASILSASLVGAPHYRKRLYWGGVRAEVLDNPEMFRQEWKRSVGYPSWGTGEKQVCSEELRDCGPTFWSNAERLRGTEGKAFYVEPGTFPLVNGLPNRVVKSIGYGNAIVPQVGALFVSSFFDAIFEDKTI